MARHTARGWLMVYNKFCPRKTQKARRFGSPKQCVMKAIKRIVKMLQWNIFTMIKIFVSFVFFVDIAFKG